MTAELYHHVIPFNKLKVEKAQLVRIMGYQNGVLPQPFDELIDQAMAQCATSCRIQGGYSIIGEPVVDDTAKTIQLNQVVLDVHNIVYHQLRQAERVAGFLCTAGPEIGNWARLLMNQGDLMMGYVVDMLGSLVVEAAMDILQEDLQTRMHERGYKTTNRYSPGYCGWSVAEQQKLFSFFPKGFCGITLSDSSLMDPIKSVSGIIGIGTRVKYNNYTCNLCDMKNCIYRNLKNQK